MRTLRARARDPLALVLKTGYMTRFFRHVLRKRLPARTRLNRLTIENQSRLTFKRAVRFRLTLTLSDGRTWTILARGNVPSADTAKEILSADHALRALLRSGFADPPYQVPKPLGTFPRLRLFLYEEVSGEVLHDVLKRRPKQALRLVRRAARWLHLLHSKKLQVGRRRTLADVQNEAKYFLDDFRRRAPELVQRTVPLLEQLVKLQARYWRAGQREARLIHNDFNPRNIILQPRSTFAIDFGGSCIGDPLSDIGNFQSQLRIHGWRHHWLAATINQLNRVFLRTALGTRRLSRAAQDRLRSYEAWWHMQLLAYSVSTMSRRDVNVIRDQSLTFIEQTLRTLGAERRPWETAGTAFRSFLRDAGAVTTFFRANCTEFFPGADEVLQASVAYPSAFSHDSLLTEITLVLRSHDNTTFKRVVRGNFVSPAMSTILRVAFGRARPLVPRLLWAGRQSGYIFYEKLPGVTLRQVPFELAVLRPIIRAIGASLASLHRLPSTSVPALSQPNELRELDSIRRRIAKAGYRNQRDLLLKTAQLAAWERRHWSHLPAVIAHNDFQGSNILLTPFRKIGFIDFSRSGRGPFPIDAAQFLTHLNVMLAPAISVNGRLQLRREFLAAYRRGLPAAWRTTLDRALAGFELRSALDILAISGDHLDARTRDRVLKPLFAAFPKLPHL